MDHHHLESLYPAEARFDELAQLAGYIKDGKSCQLIGMPGVGRGNLCKFLSYSHDIRTKHFGEAQTSFHFVFINFAEVKNRPLGDVLKFIFLELVSSLHERKLDEAFAKTDAIFKKSLSYKDDLVLFQGLKDAIDYLVHEKNLHIILTLERLELYIPLLTDDFFVHLRSLRERAKYKFSVIFSLTHPLEDIVEPKILADFYEFFADNIVYTHLYDKPGTLFRINYLQQLAGKQLPPPLLGMLLQVTGGHGKLMRLGCEALLASSPVILEQNDRIPSEKDRSYRAHALQDDKQLESFLLSQKTIQGALFELWSFLTPEEQNYLVHLRDEGSRIKDKVNIQNDKKLSFLENIGLISNNTLTIPLFSTFIAQQHPTKETETLIYNTDTDTITKGSMLLSEKLTASEFRLLKFLLSHPETILDREAIITAVWKESATTAGVTDQAVDQLIFRLRKKIEQDPNTPVHIQTVKGRGIKFTP